jgi:hypothetical protein
VEVLCALSNILLVVALAGLSLLFLGTSRALARVSRRQHELETTFFRRRRREGPEPGAPDAKATSSLRKRLRAFIPRPDDVFIVSYPRSGTTWMQMILYQLTSGGKMDFAHIEQVCLWWEEALRPERLNALASPRLFKSHLCRAAMPRMPGKFVYVARDGRDTAVSYYHFHVAYLGFRGTFDEFFERFLRGNLEHGSWFKHVRGWWLPQGEPNVLCLRYEDLQRDLDGCLQRISDFCGLRIDPASLSAIRERCSFEFMKQHQHLFDPLTAMFWREAGPRNSFLRRGLAGDWREHLSPGQVKRFEKVFDRLLGHTELAARAFRRGQWS